MTVSVVKALLILLFLLFLLRFLFPRFGTVVTAM